MYEKKYTHQNIKIGMYNLDYKGAVCNLKCPNGVKDTDCLSQISNHI